MYEFYLHLYTDESSREILCSDGTFRPILSFTESYFDGIVRISPPRKVLLLLYKPTSLVLDFVLGKFHFVGWYRQHRQTQTHTHTHSNK